jgi:hypothetical protein
MKHKTTAFRIILLLLSLPFGYAGVEQLQAGSWGAGMWNVALAFGALAYSNTLELEQKTTFSDAARGKTRWPLTPVGQVLQLIFFLLAGIGAWLWLKYG